MAGIEVERLTRQAERLRRAGRKRQAAELYRRALRRDPAHPTARQELDSLSVDSSEEGFDPADQVTVSAMERAAQAALGDLHAARQRWQAASDCYRTAVEMDDSDPVVWAKLGRSLARAGRWREAVEALDQALLLSGVDDSPAPDTVAASPAVVIEPPVQCTPEVCPDPVVAIIEPDPPAPARTSVSVGGPILVSAMPHRVDTDLADWPLTIGEPNVLAAMPASEPMSDELFAIDPPAVDTPVSVDPDEPATAMIPSAVGSESVFVSPQQPAVAAPAEQLFAGLPDIPIAVTSEDLPAALAGSAVATDVGSLQELPDSTPASLPPAAEGLEAGGGSPDALEGTKASASDADLAESASTISQDMAISVTATVVSPPRMTGVTMPAGMTNAGTEPEPPQMANEVPAAPAAEQAATSAATGKPQITAESIAATDSQPVPSVSSVVVGPVSAEPQLPAEASVDTSAGGPIDANLPVEPRPGPAVKVEAGSDEDAEDFDEDVAESTDANDVVERVPAAAVLGEEFNPRLLKRKRKRKERTEAVDLSRRGTIALRQRNLAEAIACFSRLTELLPNSAKAHRDLGAALLRADRLEEAAESLHHALELRPKFADAYASLADCYHLLGRLDRAVMCYRQTLALRPAAAKAHSNLLLTLNYHHKADPQLLCEEHLIWYDRHARPLEAQIRPHENDPDPARVIRVGYVSPDFRRHAVNFFFEPVLLNHDRTKFHLTCYSDTARPDDITEAIATRVDSWRDIRGMSDDDVAKQIREDRIDLLVDLAGHTGGNRLLVFARKPAPVQITWMGYPNTTGLPTMDWRITDLNADPPGKTEKYHTERMARLPRSFLCYAPQPEAPEITDPPMIKNGYVTFGCFNVLPKVTPDVMAAWARILQAVPKSKLILKDRNGALSYPSRIQYVRDVFRYHGVTADRLDLRGKDLYYNDHLRAYAEVDVTLDPFPYNGATTTCESLWMGVPVITLAGKVHAGRVGVSLLKTLAMTDFIAETIDSYVRKAAVLSGNKMGLTNLRHSLRARMLSSSLTDGARFTKDVEGLFRQMWSRWCKGQAAAKETHGDSGSILSLRE